MPFNQFVYGQKTNPSKVNENFLNAVHVSDVQTVSNKELENVTMKGSFNGWIDADESWSYSSYDSDTKIGVITVPSGATTRFGVGMRVKITQPTDGVKYGIIHAVSSTTITVFFGQSYDFDNEAITAPYYSMFKSPIGFDASPEIWRMYALDSTYWEQSTPGASWYNPNSHSVYLGVGAWNIEAQSHLAVFIGYETIVTTQMAISTSASSVSDTTMVTYFSVTSTNQNNIHTILKKLTVASKTRYYNIVKGFSPATNLQSLRNTINAHISAVSAYL